MKWFALTIAFGVAAISYHLKGVLIAPLILVCIFLSGSGRRTLTPRILAPIETLANEYWPGVPVLPMPLLALAAELDADQLTQVLVNLVENAIAYSGNAPSIVIEVIAPPAPLIRSVWPDRR